MQPRHQQLAAANPTRVLTQKLRPHPKASVIPDLPTGEYAALMDDIRARGLRHPLEVTREGTVLDGRHRLRAAVELGLPEVPVVTLAVGDEVEHMLRAALIRRQLTESQRAALVIELASFEQCRDEARRRSRSNLRNVVEVASLPPRGEKTRELAARTAGCGARTVQDAATVRKHNPGLFEQIKAGRVSASQAARAVRRQQRDAAIPPAPPLPQGPFQLIYADPPWQLGNPSGPHAPEQHYPTMPLAEIAALAIPAAEDALLFLWAVNSMLPGALEVIDAWGFEFLTSIVWVKNAIGLGNWTRSRHELLLLAKRGRISPPDPEDRQDSVIEAPRGRHSEKPDAAYAWIETSYPQLSKLELFARTSRRGWTAWGNQVAQ